MFDNSHCTHGTSCVNNPYFIGDRTRFIGEAKIQPYIGTVGNLISNITKLCTMQKVTKKSH